jgi:hypothetical protein
MNNHGCSTGHPPICVNKKKFATKNQNAICDNGLNCILLIFDVCTNGNANSTNSDEAKAKTPNNLSGILLKIAYANKKYHSGTI